MRTIIAGSRDNVTLLDVRKAVTLCPWNITVVISGGARGADKFGEEVAKEIGASVEVYPADWDKWGKSAGYRRNEDMANVAEGLVAVWDGVSRGTKHMIDIATKKGLKVYVYMVKSTWGQDGNANVVPGEYHPANEGVDHINIYSKSKLWLGKMLSNFARTPTLIEGFEFESLEGYWYWLKTGRKYDELKTLVGFEAKKFGQSKETVECEHFEALIKRAMLYKLLENNSLREAFLKSTLPFTHYYYYGKIENPKVTQIPKYQWIVDEWEQLRKDLQNPSYQPDMTEYV